jgi:F420-dependent oxidoreductase-like protein
MRVGVALDKVDDFALEAENLGADSVWTAEYWGYDAHTPLAYLAGRTRTIRLGTAITQVGARTPAMLAMASMSLQSLSGGRFILGLGVSGPQVMEGWHGVRFTAPIGSTRETIEIVRAISSGQRLEHSGRVYQLPLPDSAGRAIRSLAEPVHIPIYVAALGPRNLELTGELADGWIGNAFMPEAAPAFLDHLRAGAEKAGRDLSAVDLVAPVAVDFTDDVAAVGRKHADGYAFTIGAMGAANRNFYNDAFARQGFGNDVAKVQRLWLAGDRAAAAARVPIELGLQTNLIGTKDMIAARVAEYRAAGVTTLLAKLDGDLDRRVANLAQLMEVV